jgi:hypothetical protein
VRKVQFWLHGASYSYPLSSNPTKKTWQRNKKEDRSRLRLEFLAQLLVWVVEPFASI